MSELAMRGVVARTTARVEVRASAGEDARSKKDSRDG